LAGKENEVLQVGQSDWREVPCVAKEGTSIQPDISFYFGWKSLSRRHRDLAQVQGNPESMVLLENYDAKRLRGQGLIFLSWGGPREGESGDLWRPLWAELRLIHELGFVHGYYGPRWGIDSASFGSKAKHLLNLRSFLDASGFLPSILSSQLELESCSEKTCLELRGPNFENRYYLTRKKGEGSEDLGWVSFSKTEPIEKRVSHPITLLLTSQQSVFPEGTESLTGPGLWEWEGPAQYSTREKNKNAQSVYFILNPRSFRLVQGGGKGSKARVLYSGHLWNPSLQSWSRSPSQLSPEEKGENRKKTTIFIRERDAKKAKLYLQELPSEDSSENRQQP
jgi:hypothetical protein